MLSLKEEHPYVYHQFLNYGFVVQKTARRFSSIAVHQAHERNNALVKGDEGAVGLTQNPAALRRWLNLKLRELLQSLRRTRRLPQMRSSKAP